MTYPKISIVTPSFNQGQFIEETIKSVLNQEYPNLEYIIIDGGSTDRSVEIIKKYEEHLAYWVSEPDSGHAHALNKGFSKSTGEIMAWINSDDMYFPWTFKTVSKVFSEYKEVNWVHGLQSQFSSDGVCIRCNKEHKNIIDFASFDYKWIQQESVFWRRCLWDKSGAFINEEYRFMVDGELWTRFFLLDNLWHLNVQLGGLRQHINRRAQANRAEVLAEMEKCILKMHNGLTSNTIEVLNDFKLYRQLKKARDEFLEIRSILSLLKSVYFILNDQFPKRMIYFLNPKSLRSKLINSRVLKYHTIEFSNQTIKKKEINHL